ncbi:hypothetical protein ASPWEDRAFT_48642 [Aspergillus wentii DTO 134E9]|uniref:Protein transport protein sec16 n=1 Tax=Aspergillus wentii DTO 134E9 TaxID=1073089 RepID=A0A1L9RTX2_ASPWE|nr:uncharacterized protein ASPWEDRAFT_48642 [Aspergillus wentii DTO 134E9]OJJ38401.1 hypothetical protein ASPWEDRAFT_48642 [Aspergillus wentii DTO 134E9]
MALPPSDEISWNPALRPDDHECPIATKPDILTALDSTEHEQTIGTPAADPDDIQPAKTDHVEPPSDSTAQEIAAPAEIQEPVAPAAPATSTVTDWGNSPDSDDDAFPSITLEEQGERDEWTPPTGDAEDQIAQATVEEPVPNENSNGSVHVAEQGAGVTENTGPHSQDPFASITNDQAQESESAFGSTAWMDEGSDTNPAATNGEVDGEGHGFWNDDSNNHGGGEDDFFDQLKTQTKPIYVPESESRYEEGVPLLDETPIQSPIEPTREAGGSIDQIFGGDEDEDDGFFKEVQKSPPREQQFGHITRKSTSQVMDAFPPTPDSPASDGSSSTQDFNKLIGAPSSDSEVQKPSSEEDLAARWESELLEDPVNNEPSEDDLTAQWQAELSDNRLDDDDLLLEDEAGDQMQPETANGISNAPAAGLNSPFENPQSYARLQAQPTAYTPHQPTTSDLLQGVPMPGVPQTVPPSNYFSSQPHANPPQATKSESFAERSKDGYKSPYDLPEDLTRPRRTVPSQKPVVAQAPLPGGPPRSNSIPPPMASTMPPLPAAAPPPAPPVTAAPKNFYEELPLPPPRSKSRPASSGRYTPSNNVGPAVPSHGLPVPPPPVNPYTNIPPPAAPPVGSLQPQPPLQQSEPVDPYAQLLAPSAPAVPSIASRYSPKPPGLQAGTKPPASPRYSPAPPPQASAPARNLYVSQPPNVSGQGPPLPFQPRTSSPLAYHEKASYQPEGPEEQRSLQPAASLSPPSHFQPRRSIDHGPFQAPGLSGDAVDAGILKSVTHGGLTNQQQASPPRNPYAPSAYVDEFSKRVAPVNNAPPPVIGMPTAPPPSDLQFAPPRRSQTQSPGQQMQGPRLSVPSIDPFQRPASVHGSSSPTKTVSPYAPSQVSVHNRTASQSLQFIPPTDGQQLDPLERWKGAPIVKFGFGGAITSCFPRHIPRYSAGQAAPMIKSTPGEVKICQHNDWIPVGESIVQHPGPLKSKSKKKDLLAWLSSKIAAFENEGLSEAAQLHPESDKRHGEKILLWKIVRLLVENDGSLEGSAEVQTSLRNVIFPHLQNSEVDQTYGASFSSSTTFQPMDVSSRPDAVDPQAIENLRNNLLIGDREKAVWGAVDRRLWGHAMIIASTLDKSVWKQVVQEFVRREVRSTTGNTESIAALYEIFAGNIEESIDELVPPSARAGLQMISKADGHGPTKNALDGLESWRDTLGLVLSNRSPEDHQALLALGRLLSSYGRTEAAHICFIFSRAVVFGGADDPQASIVLLGADHQRFPSLFPQDEDAILLTEAYEYATSVLAGSATATLPHLLAFKLLYASSIADRGRKSEAQQYCDAIAAALKATTRPSAYHHQHLFSGVDELSARLRQTTTDGGSSWISKPSMEKVSGSMWARFNSFVAGEDSDAISTVSGKGDADIGPFAKVSGTPTVSRSPSVSDLYGSYPTPGAQPIPAGGASKYHPASQYAPSSSPEQLRGRSSLDSQRSFSGGFSFGQRRGSQEPSTPVDTGSYQGGPFYNSPPGVGYQSTPPQSSYMPLAPVEEDLAPQTQPEQTPAFAPEPSANGFSYQPPMYGSDSFGQPLHEQSSPAVSQPDSFGYMPPSATGGYEPPGATGTTPAVEVDDESVAEEPKKKSIMDDDDDDEIAAQAAAIQKAERERKDREADEAFRKAAEADAQKPAPPKKSWFGGWFGGAKKENDNNLGGGPIRAKLGEENSFYYDQDLKKWVNKKDPNSSAPVRGTPPPPRGPAPPSRTPSTASVPPAAMPPSVSSRPGSSAGAPPPSIPGSPAPSALGIPPPLGPRSVSTGAAVPTPPGSSAGLQPPPRPSTSLSNASSIDDLLGAPQARKGAAGKGKKKGRYVDVMAK